MTKITYAWVIALCVLFAPQFLQAQCDTSPSVVTTTQGLGYMEIDSGDVQTVNLMTNSTSTASFTYVLTDANFNIIRFLNGNTADLSDLDAGKYFIWGFSYTGNINLVPGQLVFTGSFSTGCFQISNTAVVIQKMIDGDGGGGVDPEVVGRFFVSSNTQANIAAYNIMDDSTLTRTLFPSGGMDADGIFYDISTDALYQLNRTNNVINAYSMVNAQLDLGNNPTISATSTSDFINGREIALSGDRLVVAQDADVANGNQNRLLIYQVTPTSINLLRTIDVDINLWGIHAEGGTLYAVVDNSNMVAIFENFFGASEGTSLIPTRTVEIEGIVRTHGLTYDAASDMMILTDIGDAANPNDGAFVIIEDFSTISSNTISMSQQIRVSGPMSMLGNPVDIALDKERNVIYVAERANGGGRVMCFDMPTTSGDAAPTYDDLFAGASAINFPSDASSSLANIGQFFASSNTQSVVGVFNILNNNSVTTTTFPGLGTDSDGIFYDKELDILYQLSRTNNVVNIFEMVNAQLDMGMNPLTGTPSTSDFTNGREITISNGRLVVAQDGDVVNGDSNRLVIYNVTSGNITFDKAYDTDINLWGIQAQGETLYAVVDNSNRIAVFNDFFNQPADSLVSPTFDVEIQGITRTHGLSYTSVGDIMILTDIGSPTVDNDGAFVVIENFGDASADGVVTMDEQIRVSGPMSMLGNPVDIAFDRLRNMIYVAERLNDGGLILGFDYPSATGDDAPVFNTPFAGASAIHLNSDDDEVEVLSNLLVSSGTQPLVGVYHVLSDDSVESSSFTSVANDADGIYYDVPNEVVYQLNRTSNVVNAYTDVKMNLAAGTSPPLSATSTSDFTNGREIAFSNDRIVVVQDADVSNGNQNAFMIYNASPSSITLEKTYTTDLNLWGVHAIGETLYAVEDNSNRMMIYQDFFNQPAGNIDPVMVITVDSLVRTHGLFYVAPSDMMILTDVGSATDATDGAIVVIQNFSASMADSVISIDEQTRIEGPNTLLGNPVDVTYDPDRKIIYVAERANGGGRMLGFWLTSSGNATPKVNEMFAGASSIHFSQADGSMFRPANVRPQGQTPVGKIAATNLLTVTAYPNPTSNLLNLLWEQPEVSAQHAQDLISIRIVDSQGREVMQRFTPVVEGTNTYEMRVGDLRAGMYFVVMQGQGALRQTRFIKQ